MWLKELNENIFINDISIPGTHNSLALRGGCWSITQDISILDQMHLGIRYLDVRLKLIDNNLKVFHSVVDQCIDMDEVLKIVKSFLFKNPSEFILLSFQEEGVLNRAEFPNVLINILHKFQDILYKNYNRIPQLKDVRGKIVLIDNHESCVGFKNNYFESINQWKDINDIDKYKKNLMTNIVKSTKNNKDVFYRTVCSANEGELWDLFCVFTKTNPRTFSKIVNPYIYRQIDLLANKYNVTQLGIIEFDFPSKKLIKRIIDSN
uniref:Phosphatidylinositol-specific phospholipase C X domain-containing protein n=1 Tax=viral metagenome TaxID=1070528 RepID=A0A6C0JAU1_9ZZZZ